MPTPARGNDGDVSSPLFCDRDPRRKPLQSKLPFSPGKVGTIGTAAASARRIRKEQEKENKKNGNQIENDDNAAKKKKEKPTKSRTSLANHTVVTPLFASKDRTGLLQVQEMVPRPGPPTISRGGVRSTSRSQPTAQQLMYTIARNGGGHGIYSDPRTYGAAKPLHQTSAFEDLQDTAGLIASSFPRPTPFLDGATSPDDLYNFASSLVAKTGEQAAGLTKQDKISWGDKVLDLESGMKDTKNEVTPHRSNVSSSLQNQLLPSSNAFRNDTDSSDQPQQRLDWKTWADAHNRSTRQYVAAAGDVLGMTACYEKEGPPLLRKDQRSRVSSIHNGDDFDFVLVLKPHSEHAFWADRLDFSKELDATLPAANGPTTDSQYPQTGETGTLIGGAHQLGVPSSTVVSGSRFKTPLSVNRKSIFDRTLEALSPKRNSSISPIFASGVRKTIAYGGSALKSSIRRLSPLSPSRRRSPNSRSRANTTGGKTGRQSRDRDSSASTTATSTVSPIHGKRIATPPSTLRRRWGNQGLAAASAKKSSRDITSPPITIMAIRTPHKTGSAAKKMTTPSNSSSRVIITSGLKRSVSPKRSANKKRKLLDADDFPSQVVPRGIAKRSHWLPQFLNALNQGLVLKRHRPHSTAEYVKILSNDGGDTIKFEYISLEEATLDLKEQAQRYNKPKKRRLHRDSTVGGADDRGIPTSNVHSSSVLRTSDQPHVLPSSYTSDSISTNDSGSIATGTNSKKSAATSSAMAMPNDLAVKQMRDELKKQKGGIMKKFRDVASHLLYSGSVDIREIVDVHIARNIDPFSIAALRLEAEQDGRNASDEELEASALRGTHSLRSSKSYGGQDSGQEHVLTLVLEPKRLPGMLLLTASEENAERRKYGERWHAGKGKPDYFRYLDFEMATEGEYFLVLQGFLSLFREAAVGRFAKERAQGFSSHFNTRTKEVMDRKRKQETLAKQQADPSYGGPVETAIFNQIQKKLKTAFDFAKGTLGGKVDEHVDDKDLRDDIALNQEINFTSDKIPSVRHLFKFNRFAEVHSPPPPDFFLGFGSYGTQVRHPIAELL
jgi:hypothetical protein